MQIKVKITPTGSPLSDKKRPGPLIDLAKGEGVMKWLISLFQIVLFCLIACVGVPCVKSVGANDSSNSLINRIEGIVWDPYRRPVSDIYVELQNENYSTVSRVRTDSTGRFTFTGYPAGHYNVKVLTSGTNYLEYTEAIDLVSVVRGGSESVYLDIYLKFDKGKINSGSAGIG